MKKSLLLTAPLTLGLCTAFALPSVAQNHAYNWRYHHANYANRMDNANLSAQDRAFMRAANRGGMAEVRLGEIASRQGATSQVRDFGRRMVRDHTKANERLMRIASRLGVNLPTEMSAQHQDAINRLADMRGDNFDSAYIEDQWRDHKATVAAFRMEADQGQNPALKRFAARTLPTLEEHLHMVTRLYHMNFGATPHTMR
jgi:putative membrane protein